jgi:predicted RNase H-like HicB family nuclease
MLSKFIEAALRRARYEIIEDDGSFYGYIPELQGVWANAPNLEQCREELSDVLQIWLLYRLWNAMPVPELDGIELNAKQPV